MELESQLSGALANFRVATLSDFGVVFKMQLELFAPRYVPDIANVTIVATILGDVIQEGENTEGNFPTNSRYELCFRIPTALEGSQQVRALPILFEGFMARQDSRIIFEEELQMAGIVVVAGSLTTVTLLESETPPKSSITARITGGAVSGILVGTVAFLLW